jgi:cytochrome c peroxidase
VIAPYFANLENIFAYSHYVAYGLHYHAHQSCWGLQAQCPIRPLDVACLRRPLRKGNNMMNARKFGIYFLLPLLFSVALLAGTLYIPNMQPFRDASGYIATYSTNGNIDQSNPFFQSLGTNGRTCATCHQANQAFGLNAQNIQALFQQTNGQDPLFAPVDGANCPNDPQGDPASHTLLLQHGLIRIGLTMPENPEFSLTVVHDPYGCAITTDPQTGKQVVSVYRRPQPSTNLGFLSTVMFDGRETIVPLNDGSTFAQNLKTDLTHQALDAVLIHAQASRPPSLQQLAEIVQLESGLYTGQYVDDHAGPLMMDGGNGGPQYLSTQPYYPGINDSLGGDPNGGTFDSSAMKLYDQWLQSDGRPSNYDDARAMIAAGEQIFNSSNLVITAVRGLNNNPQLNYPPVLNGTCTTCHDTPNVGNHSFPLPLDIGTSHSVTFEGNSRIAAGLSQLDSPDVPIYLITGCTNPQNPAQHLTFYTSDPGKGLISGRCVDVNRGKGPVLRGLAARAPYFHNGSAPDLEHLVNFYNNRFSMNLTDEQKQQLVAFLKSL